MMPGKGCTLPVPTSLYRPSTMMASSMTLSVSTPDLSRRTPAKAKVVLPALAFCLGALFLGSCASKPKTGMDAEGDAVEHRIFYEGWLHPS